MSEVSGSNLYCFEDAADSSYWDAADGWESITTVDLSSGSDDRWISSFLELETHHMPASDYVGRLRDHSLDLTSRQNAVEWILKVHKHYHFQPVTACLSVNYLDRFLGSHTLPRGNGWPFQLLSVACLSLAAKMEETSVPLLLDFQLFEPRFVFEPRTVRRMELLVMANLKWQMRAVTAFDFVDCFGRQLASFPSGSLFSRASDLILSTLPVLDFLDYRPSTVAASAVLCAIGEIRGISERYEHNVALLSELLTKEPLIGCQQLMEGLLTDTCLSARQKAENAPRSPVGVLDAAVCVSSDTQKSVSVSVNTGTSRAEPNKRRKLSQGECVERGEEAKRGE